MNTKQTRFKQNQQPFYTSSGVNSMKVFWFASVSVDMETNLLILFKAGLFRILLSKKKQLVVRFASFVPFSPPIYILVLRCNSYLIPYDCLYWVMLVVSISLIVLFAQRQTKLTITSSLLPSEPEMAVQ